MSKISKSQFESSCEDTVQCCFFSSVLQNNSDEKLWNLLCENVNNTITTLSKDYIWHRDQFKVYFPIFENTDIHPHLASITNFGENIEDEWFIVYLVLQLTQLYEDLIIQIRDNDGDFLLIEAADYLPSWVKPENSENRVFIYKKHLHIIPPDTVSIERELDLKEAIELVIKPDIETQVSSEIEQAILSRIGNYPQKIGENFHTAIVKLPIHIAGLLNMSPELIAPLVCTYCNHDVIDAKACKDVAYKDCVFTEVKFTKYLYAMLLHAKSMNKINQVPITEKDKKISIGFKLTCGFHMIMKASRDIYSSKEFSQFMKTLTKNGYFKDNIEGSKQYQELLNKAKDFFATIECPVNLHVFNKISKLMESNEYKQQIEMIKTKNMGLHNLREDNEEWLNILPEQLNELLHTRYGKKINFYNQDEITSHSLTAELSEFIKKTSDFEGIETHDVVDNENESINFDADEFTECLEKYLNIFSSKDENFNLDSDFSDHEEETSLFEERDEELDRELRFKLNCDHKLHNTNTISFNILQSMKEEHASPGPSSNLLKAVGFNKIDFLDSDDDSVD